jgi:hypothetical protein
MHENTDLPKPVRDDEGRPHTAKWRPGLEPIAMFDEARPVKLEVEILEESYRELLALMRANEWTVDEGLRTVFLAGLGFQTGQWHLDAIRALAGRDDPALTARVDTMVNELASYHSMYSVLKFKAFKLYKMNQILDFNNSGLRAQEELWHEWAARMRRDKEELQAEILRLRSLLAEFKLDWDSAGGPPLPPGIIAAARAAGTEHEASTLPLTASDATIKSSAEETGLWARLRRLFGK